MATAEGQLPEVTIYLDRETEQLIQRPEGILTRAAVEKLKCFMDLSGLDYQLIYVPWPRALARISKEKHSLIYQILRTPEREDRFYWIMQVFDNGNLELFTRTDSVYARQSLEEILSGEGRSACVRQSAQCDLLIKLGFSKKRIEVVTHSSISSLEQLLMLGRIDFIPAYPYSLRVKLAQMGHDVSRATSIASLDDSADYLAAPKHFHQGLLKRLLITSQDGLPTLMLPQRAD
ncbi:ABC transporter substrate-binding protein [Bowmanella dokdonensis]|uniref:ABC transporter substrate-binding protein n=1 Tax=Bowmanella dokdonensis TaxID=751969 RepID=A0A939IQ31_9ALTE|nr:ABC transporter substrate-binding protein [Bowmanella dokdonensis]MBN7826500.1 ABC transporter substrate-binding protein [Bowmanella dokdonensis]